jgi:hypothetical protein
MPSEGIFTAARRFLQRFSRGDAVPHVMTQLSCQVNRQG